MIGQVSIEEYCRVNQSIFPGFPPEVWQILPEFCRVVRHFSYESGFVVRDMINSRSPLEIEVLNGLSDEDMLILGEFFGLPVKPAGHTLGNEYRNDPVIRFLGGAYDDQTVYIRGVAKEIKFYAALWPWQTRPGMTTLHFGLYDIVGGQQTQDKFKNFLHEIPA